jgi:hypothetical protein
LNFQFLIIFLFFRIKLSELYSVNLRDFDEGKADIMQSNGTQRGGCDWTIGGEPVEHLITSTGL